MAGITRKKPDFIVNAEGQVRKDRDFPQRQGTGIEMREATFVRWKQAILPGFIAASRACDTCIIITSMRAPAPRRMCKRPSTSCTRWFKGRRQVEASRANESCKTKKKTE